MAKKYETVVQNKVTKKIKEMFPDSVINRHNTSKASVGASDLTIFLNIGLSVFCLEMKAVEHKEIIGFFENNNKFNKINSKHINKALNNDDYSKRVCNQTRIVLLNKNCFYLNYDKKVKSYLLIGKGFCVELINIKDVIIEITEKRL